MSGQGVNAAQVLLPGFVGTTLPGWLARRLQRGLAGVCLFAENITGPEQLLALTADIVAANPTAVIAVDEEGGDVTRLHAATGSPYPGNAVLGRLDSLEATRSVAAAVGNELRAAGITLVLGPVADVNSDPDNPVIGVRSFGDDAVQVSAHTAAWVRGAQSTGIAACVKHFPGHGDTHTDSHVALPVVERDLGQLRERELVPFVGAVAAGVRTVMTSHILLPSVEADAPATFSSVILEDVLRRELGFDGVIVSDALDMAGASGSIGIPAAAVRALRAGCDLLCIGTSNTDEELTSIEAAIERAVTTGELSPTRLADAAGRVRRLGDGVVMRTPGQPGQIPGESEIAATFDVVSGVENRLVDGSGEPVVLALATEPSIAVGTVPWGLGAAGVTVRAISAETVAVELASLPSGAVCVVVGRDNHRYRWIRDLVDALRASHPSSVVVDMGWPSADRAYADIATFGASWSVGRALAVRLGLVTKGSGQQEGRA